MRLKQRLMEYFQRGSSSIKDTVSGRKHTPDFAYARNQYLGSRLRIVCWIFIILSPIWALFDHFLLPEQTLFAVRTARIIFFVALLAIQGATRLPAFAHHQVLLSLTLLAAPALFYAALLFITAPYELPPLANYYFIPFLLVATLSIFPFTLLESLIIGLLLILVQLYSFSISDGSSLIHQIQEFWLLLALLTIAMTANHFHLSLLLRLYRQATHDQLTGLLNRHALFDLFAKEDNGRSQQPTYGTMLLDLDHFKKINDTHGHAVGDKVLQAFAELLRKHSTKNDHIARYGGEEFLLISKQPSIQQLREQAERIRQATEQLIVTDLEDDVVSCTVSIGLSLSNGTEDLQQALQRADAALYEAKDAGRNRVFFAPSP